ncbi:MAG: hypothetical protein E7283_04870 [Lachnospiraceae bacterium]|nr:hypothetical protein [Lachnospiraceae bacterium]
MAKNQTKEKQKFTMTTMVTTITKEKIYNLMNKITVIVSAGFLVKNIIGQEWIGAIAIAACLAVYLVAVYIMQKRNMDADKRHLLVSCSLMIVICFISLFSGASYSDDFLLYLAAIGLAGLYLRPQYPQTMIGLGNVLLVIQYLVAPEKAGELGQFILCMVMYNLAGIMFSMVVARGRSYIVESRARTAEMEKIIESLAAINAELNRNFEATGGRIADINAANTQVELRTNELKDDSINITNGVADTVSTCDGAAQCIDICKRQIQALVDNISRFEEVLRANESNISDMSKEIVTIKDSAYTTNKVFDGIEKQMEEIVEVVAQLKSIASSTTMLALNASIEAARAGAAGAGFAVVAGKVQQLAVDSNHCSERVEHIVVDMQEQVDKTRKQMLESTDAVDSSLATIDELNRSFNELLTNFATMYQNIEEQEASINELTASFDMIQSSVSTMAEYSEKNQMSIEEIAESIKIYGDNMEQMEADTEGLKKLAESMEEEISRRS